MGPNCTIVLKEDFCGKLTNCYLCQSTVSHHAKKFQEKSLRQIMGYKVEYFWAKLGPNSPFASKWDFLGRLTNTTIVYLLLLIMLQCLKKIPKVGQIMRNKVLQIWAKLDTNHPFTVKGDFFEKLTDVNFVYFMYHHNTIMFKKNH